MTNNNGAINEETMILTNLAIVMLSPNILKNGINIIGGKGDRVRMKDLESSELYSRSERAIERYPISSPEGAKSKLTNKKYKILNMKEKRTTKIKKNFGLLIIIFQLIDIF